MRNTIVAKARWIGPLTGWGSAVAVIGSVMGIAFSSGWLSSVSLRTPWMFWSFWACLGLTCMVTVLTILSYVVASERRQPQLVIMGFLRGDNSQPVVGFVAFLLLLYGVDLISTLVEDGAVWWRMVDALCATVNIAFGATLLVLRQASRRVAADTLEPTPVLVCPVSRPQGWTIDDLRKAPPEALMDNIFMTQAPHDAVPLSQGSCAADMGSRSSFPANINVLFGAVGFHAARLKEVHLLLTTEVAGALARSANSGSDAIGLFRQVLQEKVDEVVRLTGQTQSGGVSVTVHLCASGNDLVAFRESVEQQLAEVVSSRNAPGGITFELTNGTGIITAALLLTALKHGCQAEYVPQKDPSGQQGRVVPRIVPTTIGSIYDLARPLMEGLSRE